METVIGRGMAPKDVCMLILRTTYKRKRTLKKINVSNFEVEGLTWITQMGTI